MPRPPAVRSLSATLAVRTRGAGLSWPSRLVLAVLALVGFGVLLTALSPGARADDAGRERSAEAPGHVLQLAGALTDHSPLDPAMDATPPGPPADGAGAPGSGSGLTIEIGNGIGNGNGNDVSIGVGVGGDGAEPGHGAGGLPVLPAVVDLGSQLPAVTVPPVGGGESTPPPESIPPVVDGVTTDVTGPAVDPPVEGTTSATARASTRASVAPAPVAPPLAAPVTVPAAAPLPPPAPDPGSSAEQRTCSPDRLLRSSAGRGGWAPEPGEPSQSAGSSASVPADDAPPPEPLVPPRPVAPAPISAPPAPCGSASLGGPSGGGAHDGPHSPLAVIGDAVTASLSRESARAVSGAAGDVVGNADDRADTPD